MRNFGAENFHLACTLDERFVGLDKFSVVDEVLKAVVVGLYSEARYNIEMFHLRTVVRPVIRFEFF